MSTVLIILIAVLQAADVYLTHRILARGGRELNPALAWLFERIGFWPALIATKGVLILMIVILPVPLCLLAAVALVYIGIVTHNHRSL